eukprot:TRINITY_DN50257_c0_g1_i1.p1 TRINITY_DN50257_c0_g1~~TRINITY_DN50257_c0_g1_i1.p1  ORF type:complete len:191 (+),score=21.04 TRINITY_DN50257_c0_g1_i1:156-728(+)
MRLPLFFLLVLATEHMLLCFCAPSATIANVQTSKSTDGTDVGNIIDEELESAIADIFTNTTADDSKGEDVCLDVDWLRSVGLRDEQMLHKQSIMSTMLCPGEHIPCGTPHHLLLKQGALVSYAHVCTLQECETRSGFVNSANHLFMMRAPIHFRDLSVTACSGKTGSWQRWIEEMVVRHVYKAHRAWSMK